MYKNPIHIHDCENNHFGDPFVLRFNGKYYLYPSTKAGDTGVHCYVSDDLVNFEYAGKVFDDEISECAYAPEVVYYNGEFILCTSPRGEGHYLYKSKSPLGPFTRFTENIKNMIDGSFYIDKFNQLYFLRANHNGISILKMDKDGNTYARNDLNCPMGARTEGPGLFYFDGLYYLTYTGNNVASTGYRINYSTSKHLNYGYTEGANNPILISTDGNLVRFGHSSNVIGPDLDSIYSVYHELRIEKDNKHLPRRFLIDRFDFNGTLACVNSSNFLNEVPKKCTISGYGINDNFVKDKKIYFYKNIFKKFTFEGVIKGPFTFYFNYKNPSNHYFINVDSTISLKEKSTKGESVIASRTYYFDFNYLHTYRIVADEHVVEFFIDGALILKRRLYLKKGKAGLKLKDISNVEFNGITKEAFNSSQEKYPYVIPGMLMLKRSNYHRKDNVDGTNVGLLTNEDKVSYKTKGNKGRYFVTINAAIKSETIINVNGKIINLIPSSPEFEFNDYVLGEFDFTKNDSITLEIIKGEIEYKYFKVISKSTFNKTAQIPQGKTHKDCYQLNGLVTQIKEIEFDLNIKKQHLYQKAGALFQASNLSDDINQARYPITSMFVGIENNLLVLDFFNYGDKRIYDVPVNLEKTNHIKVSINQNNIQVYLNNELKINTIVPYLTGIGRYGFYKSVEASIELKNLQIKEEIYE